MRITLVMETARDFLKHGKKIVAVGRNYRAHAAELGNPIPAEPFVFLKPTTAYLVEGQPIKIPKGTDDIHHEVELGVVIGEGGRDIPETEAMKHVAGYTLALDMTNRTKQNEAKKKGLPWSVAKGFDTSCPVSAFIPKDKIPDAQSIELWLKVNSIMKQEGNTKDMIFPIPYLISWISERFTLESGDLVLTGTPEGVGPVKSGDTIQCGITDVTEMTFSVK